MYQQCHQQHPAGSTPQAVQYLGGIVGEEVEGGGGVGERDAPRPQVGHPGPGHQLLPQRGVEGAGVRDKRRRQQHVAHQLACRGPGG